MRLGYESQLLPSSSGRNDFPQWIGNGPPEPRLTPFDPFTEPRMPGFISIMRHASTTGLKLQRNLLWRRKFGRNAGSFQRALNAGTREYNRALRQAEMAAWQASGGDVYRSGNT
jgi:hypothetical protein